MARVPVAARAGQPGKIRDLGPGLDHEGLTAEIGLGEKSHASRRRGRRHLGDRAGGTAGGDLIAGAQAEAHREDKEQRAAMGGMGRTGRFIRHGSDPPKLGSAVLKGRSLLAGDERRGRCENRLPAGSYKAEKKQRASRVGVGLIMGLGYFAGRK